MSTEVMRQPFDLKLALPAEPMPVIPADSVWLERGGEGQPGTACPKKSFPLWSWLRGERKEVDKAQTNAFRVRLRARLSKLFTSKATRRVLRVGRRDVSVESEKKSQALEDASWIILRAAGFPTPQDARRYGEQLRVIAEFAGLCDSLGIDVYARFPQWKNWDRDQVAVTQAMPALVDAGQTARMTRAQNPARKPHTP